MKQERINRIKKWNRNPKYEKDTQPGEVLAALMQKDVMKYCEIKKYVESNWKFNVLAGFEKLQCRKHERADTRVKLFNIKNHGLDEGLGMNIRYYEFDVYEHKGVGVEDITSEFFNVNTNRIFSLEETIQYLERELKWRTKEYRKAKVKINQLLDNPNKRKKYDYFVQEPYFSQILSVMIVQRLVKKVKRGYYSITTKGRKLYGAINK